MDELTPRTSQGRALTAYVTNVVLMLVPPGHEPEMVLRELRRRVIETEREAAGDVIESTERDRVPVGAVE